MLTILYNNQEVATIYSSKLFIRFNTFSESEWFPFVSAVPYNNNEIIQNGIAGMFHGIREERSLLESKIVFSKETSEELGHIYNMVNRNESESIISDCDGKNLFYLDLDKIFTNYEKIDFILSGRDKIEIEDIAFIDENCVESVNVPIYSQFKLDIDDCLLIMSIENRYNRFEAIISISRI